MKKAIFLATLAVMTSSVLGMDPLNKKTDTRKVVSLKEVGKYISDQGLSLKSVCEYAASNRRSDDDSKLFIAATMLKRSLANKMSPTVKDCILKFLLIYKNRSPMRTCDIELLNDELMKDRDIIRMIASEDFLFHSACRRGDEILVECLTDLGENVSRFNGMWEETPLSIAIERRRDKIVKYLIEHGTGVDSALHEASVSGRENIVKCLAEHGVDLNKEDRQGKTPLCIAVENRRRNIVECLIEHGADVNKEDKWGETALRIAVICGYEGMVRCLVERGADVNIWNRRGETPLNFTCSIGSENIAKYLVEHGADVNKENRDGNTPLHAATEEGRENIVKYLLEHGADVNKENRDGNTPLHVAIKKERENIAKYLVEHGADVNKENGYGKTPLYIAFVNGHEDIVKYLIEHGARE